MRKDQKEELTKLVEGGMSMPELRRHFGLSDDAIRRNLRALGLITPRDKTRVCPRCNVEKNEIAFGTSGQRAWCDECREVYYSRREQLEGDFYWDRFKIQDGRCAICGTGEGRLLVDHRHATGEKRGLLCARCNSGLGYFKDNVEALRRAVDYLNGGISLSPPPPTKTV